MLKFFGIILIGASLISCGSASDHRDLTNYTDSTSYSLGMLFASKIPDNLKQNFVDTVSIQHFLQGVQDYFDKNNKSVLTSEEAEKIVQQYFISIQENSKDFYASKFKHNITKGEAFLQKNKKQANVFEFKKGLQYQVWYGGWTEIKPSLQDTLLVHFKISTIDNKVVYDSKKINPNPLKIRLDSCVAAWQHILPLMNMGAKLRIFSSHEFAYGISPSKEDVIQPYQTLIFDIEFIRILKGQYASLRNAKDSVKEENSENTEEESKDKEENKSDKKEKRKKKNN